MCRVLGLYMDICTLQILLWLIGGRVGFVEVKCWCDRGLVCCNKPNGASLQASLVQMWTPALMQACQPPLSAHNAWHLVAIAPVRPQHPPHPLPSHPAQRSPQDQEKKKWWAAMAVCVELAGMMHTDCAMEGGPFQLCIKVSNVCETCGADAHWCGADAHWLCCGRGGPSSSASKYQISVAIKALFLQSLLGRVFS